MKKAREAKAKAEAETEERARTSTESKTKDKAEISRVNDAARERLIAESKARVREKNNDVQRAASEAR